MIFFWLLILLVYGAFLAAVVGLAVLAVAYVLLPALFYLGHKRPLEPIFLPITDFSPHLARDMEWRVRALQVLGYEEQARLSFLNGPSPAYIWALSHAETGDQALVVALVPRESLSPYAVYVEIRTRFEKDEVRTVNSPDLRASSGARVTQTWLPLVRDVGALVAMHRYICHKIAPGERGDPFGGSHPQACLAREMKEEDQALAHEGFLCVDEQLEVWRPTWRGACLLTWKNLWPQARARRARAKAVAAATLSGFKAPS